MAKNTSRGPELMTSTETPAEPVESPQVPPVEPEAPPAPAPTEPAVTPEQPLAVEPKKRLLLMGESELRTRAINLRLGVARNLEMDVSHIHVEWVGGAKADSPARVVLSVDRRGQPLPKVMDAIAKAAEKVGLQSEQAPRTVPNGRDGLELVIFEVYEL